MPVSPVIATINATVPPSIRSIKWLALALALGAVAATLLLLGRHRDTPAAPAAPAATQPVMEQPVIIENSGGKARWKLRATKAEQGPTSMRLTRPYLEMYDDHGQTIPIRGDAAWFDPLARTARFVGHVTIDYRQWHLQSAEALFDGGSGQLHIPERFLARGDRVTMRGADLTVDQPRQRIMVRRHIRIEDQR